MPVKEKKSLFSILRVGQSRVNVGHFRMLTLALSVALMAVGCDGGGDGY